MTTTMTEEYRQLGYDTSNDMIRHDARRTDRKYEEAALHIRDAGLGRLRMGQMMYDAGEFALAVEDWLSAAACFYLVPDLERMNDATELVRKLDCEGKIPPERRDLHAALKEREEQLVELDSRLKQFRIDYSCMVGSTRMPMPEALDFLRKKVRDLPGYPKLHAEISGQAMGLGQQAIARESLDWAIRFDPDSPHLKALRASQLFAFGEPVQAAAMARAVLATHPEMESARFLLAQALAFRAGANFANWKPTDWEEALGELNPLIEHSSDPLLRLTAIALAANLQHGLGREVEYRRLLDTFDQLSAKIGAPVSRTAVSKLRQSIPQASTQPGSNGAAAPGQGKVPRTESDHPAQNHILEELNPLAGIAA